jgi:hypothetical protein
MTMLSHDDCLARAIDLERRAEAAPDSDRNYDYMAAAWRRLAVQAEWQDRLLATLNREVEPRAESRSPDSRLPMVPPLNANAITFRHIETPGQFVFSSPELPGWKCAGLSREHAGKKVIGSWRNYLAKQHDLDTGVRAELASMLPYREAPKKPVLAD